MPTSYQAQRWLDLEGDVWLDRNRAILGDNDPVCAVIQSVDLKPKRVLEVGCSNGWRIHKLVTKYGCDGYGIDPSKVAIAEAGDSKHFYVGTADSLPFAGDTFDMVILGFCMWAIAPEDWFKVVAETTRVLINGGHLVIHDYCHARPHKTEYRIGSGIYMYFMDFTTLWTSHPGYQTLSELQSSRGTHFEVASVLYKDFNSIPVGGKPVLPA